MSLLRGAAVRDHEQPDADLDRDALRLWPVADDDHVAHLEAERERAARHREHPHAARHLRVRLPHELLALEHAGDRADRRRGVEPRRPARLAHVAPRQRALGHHAGQPPAVVDDRHEVDLVAGHDQADLAHRVALARRAGSALRMTSRTRSSTCGSSSGSGAPLRSSTQRVCAFSSPSRTGTYSLPDRAAP